MALPVLRQEVFGGAEFLLAVLAPNLFPRDFEGLGVPASIRGRPQVLEPQKLAQLGPSFDVQRPTRAESPQDVDARRLDARHLSLEPVVSRAVEILVQVEARSDGDTVECEERRALALHPTYAYL